MSVVPSQNPDVSKAEYVYLQLRDDILTGVLASKERLVLDRLARKYDVSAVPVREAIRRLEAEGLVNFKRNVGAVVTPVSERDLLDSLETLAVIESYVTGVSAALLDDAEIAEAEALNEKMRAVVRHEFSPDAFSVLNAQFHQLLASKCENPRLLKHLQQEWNQHSIQRLANHGYTLDWCVRSVTEHTEILKLVKAKAPSHKIEAYCRAHNMRVVKQLTAQATAQKSL
ncbi:GntR family transcriptional regulator [Gleimia sp. 6138-11-ORH1]|uniref:GntR family transcriptional regulator n=1 Tax=Gleimia sp. 6138-11-ORH1 TaxID=2973937 RepID=UPI0021677417|nr:GntR family transcriptional regulator [Gleimia sp. 6138-11-ORH1]MCS4484163.1 GntR family transcriptional regulator [Gleimia sp. 6138-11-ORH1]